uniref:Uncharacterized protein n=2 Tax=Anguilla anguilla TaxID=7936 RepID=A0A0E9SXT3_ANGAN
MLKKKKCLCVHCLKEHLSQAENQPLHLMRFLKTITIIFNKPTE